MCMNSNGLTTVILYHQCYRDPSGKIKFWGLTTHKTAPDRTQAQHTPFHFLIDGHMCYHGYRIICIITYMTNTVCLQDCILGRSQSTDGLNSSLVSEFMLLSHMYCHKILWLLCFAFTPPEYPFMIMNC